MRRKCCQYSTFVSESPFNIAYRLKKSPVHSSFSFFLVGLVRDSPICYYWLDYVVVLLVTPIDGSTLFSFDSWDDIDVNGIPVLSCFHHHILDGSGNQFGFSWSYVYCSLISIKSVLLSFNDLLLQNVRRPTSVYIYFKYHHDVLFTVLKTLS